MTRTIPVKLPDQVVMEVDELIKKGKYLSRSDFLRFSARFMLQIESGLLYKLSTLRGELKTAKTVSQLKKDAELEGLKEVKEKRRRTSHASS